MLVLLIGDAFENALFYLCNFETAININGGETPMVSDGMTMASQPSKICLVGCVNNLRFVRLATKKKKFWQLSGS